MKTEFYTQCKLRQITDDGYRETTAFIPSKYAVVGKELVIKKIEDWTVVEVFEQVEYNEIKGQQHNSGNIWDATSGSIIIGHK